MRQVFVQTNCVGRSTVVKLRRPFGTALRGLRLHFTQISFENVTQEKIHNPSSSRRSPRSSFSSLARCTI